MYGYFHLRIYILFYRLLDRLTLLLFRFYIIYCFLFFVLFINLLIYWYLYIFKVYRLVD